jgi:small-conductance mechanosensitive channel
MKMPVYLAAVVLAVTVGVSASAFGQGSTPQTGVVPPTQPETLTAVRAPVVIDGAVLFTVRGISAFPAEQRAAAIEARIRTLAGEARAEPPSLTLEDQPGTTWILANGQRLIPVHDEDAALEAVDRRLLAEAYRLRIASAVAAYRADRQPAVLWRHALLTLGATLALIVGAFICRRIFRWLQSVLERRYRERVRDVSIQSFQVVRAEQLWGALSGILSFVWGFTVVGMLFVYLRYTLGLFPWTRGAGNRLVALALDPLRNMGTGFVSMIPNLAFLAMLFLVVRYVLKVVRLFFSGVAEGTVRLRSFDRDWALPTYRLLRVAVVAFALVVAYPYVPGSDTEAFKGVTLFIGVIFSLGSSSLIGNIISGYSMTYRRTFRLGDRVQVGSHVGKVQEMRLLVTHLLTAKNEEVIVPNSSILASEVVNYSSMAKEPGLILHTTVGIGYETPWRQVEAMLLEAAARTQGLLRDRPAFVHLRSLGDFCVTYEINAYCDTPDRMLSLYTELHRNILDVFNEYGVQIMTPAYEGDPAEAKVVPKERWFTDPARPAPGSTLDTPR